MKFAAPWPVQHAWNFAFDGEISTALAGVGLRLRGNQAFGIGVQRLFEDFTGGANFDEAAQIHDSNPVRDMAHHGKIVGDDKVTQAHDSFEFRHQVQDFALHGDIKACRGFVSDDQLGMKGKSPGHADAAGLAA